MDLDKEKVKKRKAEKNAQEAEDELQVDSPPCHTQNSLHKPVFMVRVRSKVVLSRARMEGHNEMLELVRELEEEIRNLKASRFEPDQTFTLT